MRTDGVALKGGPRDGWWYWESEWQQLRRASIRMGEVHHRPPDAVESWPLRYVETGECERNPSSRHVDAIGTVWRWKP